MADPDTADSSLTDKGLEQRERLLARLRARGFEPDPRTIEAVLEALPAIDLMRAHLRADLEHADEPALVFVPGRDP